MQFTDRAHAAKLLSNKLKKFAHDPKGIVLAIPRGGVELGAVLADELQLSLDVVVSKKICAPGNPEFAIGSVNMRGEVVLNTDDLGTTPAKEYIDTEVARVKQAIQEKLRTLRGTRPFPDLKGKHVIVVDDGIATGSTMKGALEYVRAERPDVLIMAVPVAPVGARDQFDPWCDEILILSEEPSLGSVGAFYNDFPQVEDSRAKQLLTTRWLSA
ncbi:MAG: phosphoribosyltransferase family protein [Patescibacteria group bacterium]